MQRSEVEFRALPRKSARGFTSGD